MKTATWLKKYVKDVWMTEYKYQYYWEDSLKTADSYG